MPNDVAVNFCDKMSCGDYMALEFLKDSNKTKRFLDWDTECLLYFLISLNTILEDYFWLNSIELIDDEVRPPINNNWLTNLEDVYNKSKIKLINRFSNIKFNNNGELEICEMKGNDIKC